MPHHPCLSTCSVATSPKSIPNREILVLDASVEDRDVLLRDLPCHVDVIVAEPAGLARLVDKLAAKAPVEAMHIVTHGEPGAFNLAGTRIDEAGLAANEGLVGALRNALASGAKLALWACSVGASASGRAFTDSFAALTGAKIFASDRLVGAQASGGTWEIAGVSSPFSREAMALYPHTLPASNEDFQGISPQIQSNSDHFNNDSETDWNFTQTDTPAQVAVAGQNNGPAFNNDLTNDFVGDQGIFMNYNDLANTTFGFEQSDGDHFALTSFEIGSFIAGRSTSLTITILRDNVAVGSATIDLTTSSSSNGITYTYGGDFDDGSSRPYGTFTFDATYGDVDQVSLVYAGNATPIFDNIIVGTPASSNNAPTIDVIPTDITVTEDAASNLSLVTLDLTDTDDDELTVTLTIDSGTFTSVADGAASGVTETLVSNTEITLVGNADEIEAYLSDASVIQYLGANNDSGDDAATLTINLSDGTDSVGGTSNIDITAVNDTPSFGGDLTSSLNEDTDSIGGTATVTDVDSGESSFNADTISGTYGDLTIAANGDWVYDLDEANTDVQGLLTGDTLGDTLTVSSADGTTQDIVITVNGVSDAATFGGDLTSSLNEDTDSVAGTATVSDADGADSFNADTLTGTYGDLTIAANGDWVYDLDEANTDVQALAAGDTLGDTLTVAAADGTTRAITLTINGVNDAASFGGTLSTSLNEDTDTIGGTATVSDVDTGEASFNADTVSGTYGDLTIAANGDWVYDLDEANTDVQALAAGDTLGDTVTVAAADGTTQAITITITGVNDAPQSSGGSVDATEGLATTFSAADFAFSDPDTGDSLQSVRIDTLPAAGSLQLSGTAVTAGQVIAVANIANLTYTPADDDDSTRSFTFSVSDGTDWSASATMSLDVTSTNDAPSRPRLATSGVTENEAGALVGTLSATDPEGDDVTFVVEDSRFRIDGNKLYLASGTSFDYESQTSVTVRVFAYDEEGLYSSAYVDVPVLNVVNEGTSQSGSSGSDTISGSAGGDTLTGGGGNDQLDGGEGDDMIMQNDDDDSQDIIVGGEGNDSINAGGGNDFVVGGGATDGSTRQSLNADSNPNGRGSDTIRGGSGDDTILGGGWNDDLVDDDGWYTDGEEVEGDTDQNQIWAGSGRDMAAGSGGDDLIGGSTGQDTLKGLGGDDTLYGNDDSDSLLGGNGDDLLYGGSGDDTVDGGAGDDRIWAGAGDDLLTGGDGSDTFAFGASAGNDTISDFNTDEDSLDLAARGFADLAAVEAASSDATVDGESGLLIDLGDGESVFLVGLAVSDLSAMQITV
jgi:VCBS repeat-containing protein